MPHDQLPYVVETERVHGYARLYRHTIICRRDKRRLNTRYTDSGRPPLWMLSRVNDLIELGE